MKASWFDPSIATGVIERYGPDALRLGAERILEESKKQVPYETGALSNSGQVSGDGLDVTISYDTPYAVRWHENDASFRNGRKKKYLEDPCNDTGIQHEIMQALQKGIKF